MILILFPKPVKGCACDAVVVKGSDSNGGLIRWKRSDLCQIYIDINGLYQEPHER
jgi:hypothetical protein